MNEDKRLRMGRVEEWNVFSENVEKHIKTYTIGQYGDLQIGGDGDQMQKASLKDIQMNLKRYINRMDSNSRGKEEAIRDLLKVAHYAAILWGKYQRNEIIEYIENDDIFKIKRSDIDISNIDKHIEDYGKWCLKHD